MSEVFMDHSLFLAGKQSSQDGLQNGRLPSSVSTMQQQHSAPLATGMDIGCRAAVATLRGSQQAAQPALDSARYPGAGIPIVVSGKKFDGGKAPIAQAALAYFGRALEGVAQISAYGAKKYNVPYIDQNWRKVDNAAGRYADALVRHLTSHLRGELIDAESGKPHIDMVAWNALALSELSKTGGCQIPEMPNV